MRIRQEHSEKLNNAVYFLAGMVCVVFLFVIVLGIKARAQGTKERYEALAQKENVGTVQESAIADDTAPQQLEKWQEGIIEYEGRSYQYNSNLKSYLFMGIDRDDPATPVDNGHDGGQSDAMFLVVTDSSAKTMRVISIHRNTMTNIDMYDINGNYVGVAEGQICLAHAFGDGRKLSCTRSVDVVRKLFDYIPISGYVALNMGGIPRMNDAIGGVEVVVLEDMSNPDYDIEFQEGDIVTLSGAQAYGYLRGRDVDAFDSATQRLRRQEQYITAFMSKLRNSNRASTAVKVYQSVEDYLVTSVDFEGLLTEFAQYEFEADEMLTVPGTVTSGEEFEEYHVDENAFKRMIMEVFYKEVK